MSELDDLRLRLRQALGGERAMARMLTEMTERAEKAEDGWASCEGLLRAVRSAAERGDMCAVLVLTEPGGSLRTTSDPPEPK